MSLLVAVEGADGAGKATAAGNVRDALLARGITARVISFPRYGETVGGVALGEFLSGRMPIPVTAKAAAVLYGLDRLESVSFIAETAAACDVVIFDRYIASNMVYQASKVEPENAQEFMGWILRLETEMLGVPPPDLSIYLDTPLDTARELMLLKNQRSYTDRQYDEHEADIALQNAVRRNYAAMADLNLAGPWRVVRTTFSAGLRPPLEIAAEIVDHVLAALDTRRGDDRDRMTASHA
jgi:dTMP kinase